MNDPPPPARISHRSSSRGAANGPGSKACEGRTTEAYSKYVEGVQPSATQETGSFPAPQQRAGEKCGLTAFIDEVCAPWAREDSPGCVVAVLHGGEVLHSHGYGMADLERAVPLSPRSQCDIGSLSKQFTAMCVALLARQGKLALDDDIRRYLPEMRQYDAPITVRHLVHHMGGVREYLDLLGLAGRRHLDASAAQVLALLARQRGLNFVPGERYQYSNSGYVLLAAIVARAAGCSLGEYAEAALFRPLGMSGSRFAEGGRTGGGDLALAYSPRDGGGFTVDASGINLAGDGALLTTAEDLCRWERNFYDNRLGDGGPELMRQVAAAGRLDDGEATGYGFGLMLGKLGRHTILRHGGNYAGYRAALVRCPEQRLSVVCLANLGTIEADAVARRIAAFCLGEPARPPAAAVHPAAGLPAAQLAAWTGLFVDEAAGRVWRLSGLPEPPVDGGGLIAASGPDQIPLVPIDADHLRAQDSISLRLTRERREDGSVARLVLEQEGEKPMLLEAVQPAAPTAEELNEFAGSYACDELEVTHQIRQEAGQLSIQMPAIPFPVPLTPMARDEFTTQGVLIRFLRDPARQVGGFSVTSSGVKELRFTGPG